MTDFQKSWFEGREELAVHVSADVTVTAQSNVTVVFVRGKPIGRLVRSDAPGLRAELAMLESTSVVSQAQVARCGLVAAATFHRDCVAFRQGGRESMLQRTERGTKACKPTRSLLAELQELDKQQHSAKKIAKQLGIGAGRVNRILGKATTKGQVAQLALLPSMTAVLCCVQEQPCNPETPSEAGRGADCTELPAEVAPTDEANSDEENTTESQTSRCPSAQTGDGEPPRLALGASEVMAQRQWEQTQARFGRLQEQSVLFPPVEHARYAGVLLGLSLLSVTGLLANIRATLPVLKKGYYGVRSIVTTLLAMAFLRCKRPEQLKGFDPGALGAVLGLDRAPEMKTLRCKFKELAQDKSKVEELMREMATAHVERVQEAVAFLYIDGHVRPYFGDKSLSKAHITAMRISLPATTDYWVGDSRGEPLLVVTTEGNAAMTQTLPSLLKEVRQAVGAEARPTIVFDRGGFCGKLFGKIVEAGFDFITYRKGNYEAFAAEDALEVTIRRDGKERTVKTWDRRVELKEYGSIRCVAVLRSDGKQTHVLTSRDDLSIREVLERMFSRWQQENFFKYLGEEFALDALWTYGVDQADPERTVPNPQCNALSEQIASLRRQIAEHQKTVGVRVLALVEGDGSKRKKPSRGAGIDPVVEIAKLEEQVKVLKERRKALPERVHVATLRTNGNVFELARAPMLLSDIIKMTAYHIETMLLTMVAPHLKRAHEEGRAFLADVMQLDGRLTPQADCLEVSLKSPSAPRYRRALEGLCEQLNSQDVTFPETPLRLRFSVVPPLEG